MTKPSRDAAVGIVSQSDMCRNLYVFEEVFDILVPVLFDKVIPRLLRPLESEGRSVKPSLVHGDLWYANSGIDMATYESLVFDACSFYAHNECT